MHAVLREAIELLVSSGHDVVATDDVPGLFWVDGRELTINQVIQLSRKLSNN